MTIRFYFIDPDASEIQLGEADDSYVKSFSGLGMAPLTHFLQGIPSQHRQLHRGLKFRPRIVQLAITDIQASAIAQDTRHQTLLTALNPDRGEGSLKIVLNDATERRLNCYVQEGPDFASEDRPGWGQYQMYVVRFVARDPFLYDPSQKSASGYFNGADVEVNNAGHVGTYPTIIIAGEVQNPKLTLETTGEVIEFTTTVADGSHIDVDCEEGIINLDDVAMDPLTLTKASTLFALPRGDDQTIRLTCTAGASAVEIKWYNRYLGI